MTTSLIALVRDHSGSMNRIAAGAMRDYNATISAIKAAAHATAQPTYVSVCELGYEGTTDVRTVISHQPVEALTPLTRYEARGGTPLWDAVSWAVKNLLSHPLAGDPTTAFCVMITTDGRDEHSKRDTERTIQDLMDGLNGTDRWTFVFRVPNNEAQRMLRMGIPEGNILPWDQSAKSVQATQEATTQAFTEYFSGRSKGMTSTKKFFANMADVKLEDVKHTLNNIGSEVQFLPVGQREHDKAIREFIEDRLGDKMLKGAAFYQLTKNELKVQGYKLVAVRNQKTGEVFAGPAARQLVGLPSYDAKVAPDNLGEWDVFIQSTSVNRKVAAGTNVMYWPGVGKRFTEGKSA